MADDTAEVTLPEISVIAPESSMPGTSPDAPNTSPGDIGGFNQGSSSSNGSVPITGPGTSASTDLGGFNSGAGAGVNTQAQSYRIPDLEESRGIITSVAPAWRFIAIMPKIDKKVGSALTVSDAGASYNSAKTLSGSNIPIAVCANVSIPPVTIDTDTRSGGGTRISVARFVSTGQLNISFYEDEDYGVSKYLWAWHTSIVNDDNLFYLPNTYKKDIKVWAFGNRSNTKPAVMYDFIECMPTISAGGLEYALSENGFLTVSCDFTIDNQNSHFS